eukprot:TRINITY_DN13002_c0_g1_i1.p1 TRINITY_DN13002_c0_g1~~TRINITY_DN13002_c0_g1_i1.p1  ORF type:complete len:552 (-),score=120.87 TRINITY_DN13002_c0_g1_i1:16-1671(-)
MNRISSLFFVLALCVTLGLSFNESDYTHSALLSNDADVYTVFWKVEGDEIYMAFKVKTLGWIAFGISEQTSGSMPGADIVEGYVDDDGVAHINDRYSVEFALPPVDDCQDWGLIGGEEDGEYTIIEVVRKLDTNDTQDRPIESGNVRVIIAYGTSDTFGYHTMRRATSVVFYGESPVDDLSYLLDEPNTYFFDFLNKNTTVPTQRTYYGHTQFTVPLEVDVHIIGIKYILDPRSEKYIHHFVLSGFYEDSSEDYIWEWAPGISPLILPSEAGFRVGPNSIRLLELETHYDNPSIDSGIIDNSGLRIYYTTTLRKYDAGVLQLGDPAVQEIDPVQSGVGIKEYEYSCPSECTQYFPHDLKVFSSFLHMHAIGSKMYTTQWRNDTMVRVTSLIEYWDFNFQQQTSADYVIKPGDRLNTHCFYKKQNEEVPFGLASDDEMCIHYISYYPKLPYASLCGFYSNSGERLTYCFGTPTSIVNPQISDPPLNTKFGIPNDDDYMCPNDYVPETTEETSQTSSTSQSTGGTDAESEGSIAPGILSQLSLITCLTFLLTL